MNDKRVKTGDEKRVDDRDSCMRNNRASSTRSVHFSQPVSPEIKESTEEINNLHYSKDETTNHLHLVISIFSLLVGSVAVGGCILLYFELTNVNEKVEMQKYEIFGNSKSHFFVEQGWVSYFQRQTDDIDKKIMNIKAWINTTACIEGDDFTTDKYCFRLLNFKVNFNQAERFCKERHGMLAFADSEGTWNKTINFLKTRGFLNNEIWTGVQKNSLGIWKYADGRKVTFSRWGKGNIFDQGDNCAKIRVNQKSSVMYDCRCSDDDPEPRAFLCQFLIN